MDKGRKNLEEMLGAMESTDKWEKFVTAKNQVFTEKIDTEKAGKFVDYLTQRFIDSCNDKTVFGSFQNWENKSSEERITITEKIVKIFLQNIKNDIWNDKVTIYVRDGSEYIKTNDTADQHFKEDITNIPDINITARDVPGAMMGTTHEGNLYINTNYMLYEKTPLFFLMDLKHELTHIIDMFIPAISPLDPETREQAFMFYVNPKRDFQLYKNNPVELHANLHRKDLRIKLQQMLDAQSALINDKSKTI